MPISYSQIATYRRCPRQYEYAFLKKLKRPLSAGESFGSSIHNTLKKWGEIEMEHIAGDTGVREDQMKLFLSDAPPPGPESPLTWETLRRLWHASFIVEGYASRVEADFQRALGERMLMQYFDWWSQREHSVLAIETGFSWTLVDGTTITGRIDRIERVPGGLKIVDYKTGALRDQAAVDGDMQLSLYALAVQERWNEPVVELAFLFLTDDGIREVMTERTKGQLTDVQKSVAHVVARIATGDLKPTPGRMVCSRCPYRGVCDVAAA